MYKNILLPTDGLGKCKFGTCHGILLAKTLNARLTAVHLTGKLSAREILEVYHSETLWSPSEGKKAKESMDLVEKDRHETAHKALEVAKQMAANVGVPCETVHIIGEAPVDGILRVANEKGCDLIFISTHGNPGIMGTLFGSIATKIMSHSRIPVLSHYCGGPG